MWSYLTEFASSHPYWTSLVAYTVVSGSALRLRTLIQATRSKITFPVTHTSHRGGGGERPENTLDAFRNAVNHKSDLLELDVHLTKDNEVVVIHDGSLGRVTGKGGKVKDYNYNEMPLVAGTHRIPKLEDVFEACKTHPFNIDLKAPNDLLLDKVHALIKKHKLENRVIWGSGFTSKAFSNQVYSKDPSLPLFFPISKILQVYLLYWSGLLPFVSLKESAFEIPIAASDKIDLLLPNSSQRTKNFIQATLNFIILQPTLIAHLRARGIRTVIWTCNQEHEMAQAFRAGVDGVMTDYPSRLRAFLNKKST